MEATAYPSFVFEWEDVFPVTVYTLEHLDLHILIRRIKTAELKEDRPKIWNS